MFTSREGYPSKWDNPSWRAKIAQVYKQNVSGRVTPQPGPTSCMVWKLYKVNPGSQVNPTWSVYKRKC